MSRKWFSILALIAAAAFLFNLSSCAFNQHLVSIQVAPTAFTFGAATPLGVPISGGFYFSATGTYEHPPKTIDITNLVTWGTDNPQVLQVSSTGVASAGYDCGVANVTASYYDSPNLVSSNTATVTVDGPASLGCTPAGTPPILTVDFSGQGTGTVVSSPAGIDCPAPSSCNASFTAGSTVNLTGTPTGNSSTVTWSGCGTVGPLPTQCSLVLENNAAVTVTFQ